MQSGSHASMQQPKPASMLLVTPGCFAPRKKVHPPGSSSPWKASAAILFKLLSVNSMSDSWMGTCKERRDGQAEDDCESHRKYTAGKQRVAFAHLWDFLHLNNSLLGRSKLPSTESDPILVLLGQYCQLRPAVALQVLITFHLGTFN